MGARYPTHYSLRDKSAWGPGRTGVVLRGGKGLSFEPPRGGVELVLPRNWPSWPTITLAAGRERKGGAENGRGWAEQI